MDWENFQSATMHDNWSDPISSFAEWTQEENRLFEQALATVAPGSPGFFEEVAASVPWKTIDQIKSHYQALVDDVEMIESGRCPIPDYDESTKVVIDVEEKQAVVEDLQEVEFKKSDEVKKSSLSSQQRRRGIPWTEEEHRLFLMGMNRYGKGDWRSISRFYVLSRTPTQVASHAQKYFRRQSTSTPSERRRPSIHDVQIMNPTTTTVVPPPQVAPWNGYPNIF